MILRGGHRLVFRGGSVGARIEETQYVEDTELAMVPAGVDAVARIDWECEVANYVQRQSSPRLRCRESRGEVMTELRTRSS